ncbi:MAG: sigma-54-dependent transcriptional regulator [Candidatus Zixiibacteriota bacterium]
MIECRALFVDDDEFIRRVTKRGLENSIDKIVCVASVGEALKEMTEAAYDVVITDLRMNADTPESEMDGFQLIRTIRETYPNTEVILQTGYGSLVNVEKALRVGASDYIEKPYKIERLLLVIERALESRRFKRELAMLRQQVAFDYGYDGLIGETPYALRLKESIRQASEHERPVLIIGEPGCGKDLAAKIIHHHSTRRRGPLHILDCRATPERLIDSELFGRAGAGGRAADSALNGLLEQARGGSILIKSIDALPRETQAKLVSVMRDGGVSGAADSPSISLDVRILATTSANLYELATQGRFLEELLERIGAVTIAVPALRQRKEDIQSLAESFLRTPKASDAGRSGSSDLVLTGEALEKMMGYAWPENVRELKNVVRRATALARASEIMPDDIFFSAGCANIGRQSVAEKAESILNTRSSMEMTYRSRILKSLEDNNWNYSRTALELGIGRTTLWRKVKKFNLSKETLSDTGR